MVRKERNEKGKYRVILNYWRVFRGLKFSNRKQQNKTAYGISICNSVNQDINAVSTSFPIRLFDLHFHVP
jgi:hypothetical protein